MSYILQSLPQGQNYDTFREDVLDFLFAGGEESDVGGNLSPSALSLKRVCDLNVLLSTLDSTVRFLCVFFGFSEELFLGTRLKMVMLCCNPID